MKNIEQLLNRLEHVKGRNGQWTARCPAHADRGPSLSIREAEDGRVLIHCFAGCDVHNIVQSVGMDIGDLFPPDEKRKDYSVEGKPKLKPAFFASDLMRIIAFEALVVQIAAFDMANGKKLNDRDKERMMVAYERIDEAMRYANVN
jgi:hypothetical protein